MSKKWHILAFPRASVFAGESLLLTYKNVSLLSLFSLFLKCSVNFFILFCSSSPSSLEISGLKNKAVNWFPERALERIIPGDSSVFGGLIFPGKQLQSQPILLSTLPKTFFFFFFRQKEHWERQETERRSSQYWCLSFGVFWNNRISHINKWKMICVNSAFSLLC